jgi:hypothetical protein
VQCFKINFSNKKGHKMILGDFYSRHKFQNSIQKYEVAGDLLSSVKHNPNKHRKDQQVKTLLHSMDMHKRSDTYQATWGC